MTKAQQDEILEAVLDAVLEADVPIPPAHRISLANLVRREVARKLHKQTNPLAA